MADQRELRQACPECENGEGLNGVAAVVRVAPFVKCWRCDGHGLVEIYDDLAPKIVLHEGAYQWVTRQTP